MPPTTYSVTYNGNTNGGGSAPSDGATYASGATVTVAGNTGSLTKAGYTFGGWCTTQPAAGSPCGGTSRAAASTFAISANTTLYAVWADTTAPSISSLSPVDNATGVAVGVNLVVTFGENVSAVAGKYVRVCTGTSSCTGSSVAGDVVQVVEATNAAITISSAQVTINPASDLSESTTYYLSIDSGAFRDAALNDFAGLSAGATWNFTTVTCAEGGVCAVGDTGPGGGTVFYVHASGTFSCGATVTSTCKYLEAAPADASGNIVWAATAAGCYNAGSSSSTNDCQTNSVYSGDTTAQSNSRTASQALGMGLANTNQVYARLTTVGSAATADYAAGVAWDYTNGGMSDWFLPSMDELNEMCKYARNTGQAAGAATVCTGGSDPTARGFSADIYGSSTENSANIARLQSFVNGANGTGIKSFAFFRARPIRAFGGTLSCADGGTCAVGDTGPGGGIVFYVASSNFASTGSDCNMTCRYLEAAPAPGGGDEARSWATNANSNQTTAVPAPGATATGIGSGMANTNAIQAQTGNVAASSAAVYAYDYSNGGKTDWHLPSKDELNELCKYAKNQSQGTTATLCAGTGVLRSGFSATDYWSSSESSNVSAAGQAFYNVPGATQYVGMKNLDVSVRPVRAFG